MRERKNIETQIFNKVKEHCRMSLSSHFMTSYIVVTFMTSVRRGVNELARVARFKKTKRPPLAINGFKIVQIFKIWNIGHIFLKILINWLKLKLENIPDFP